MKEPLNNLLAVVALDQVQHLFGTDWAIEVSEVQASIYSE